MCGIVAALCRSVASERPDEALLSELAIGARRALPERDAGTIGWLGKVNECAAALGKLDRELRSLGGLALLVDDRSLAVRIAEEVAATNLLVSELEGHLDDHTAGRLDSDAREGLNAAFVRVKDALWSIERDRLRLAGAILSLSDEARLLNGHLPTCAALEMVLSALDRLEVRGRDSAGVHLLVPGARDEVAPEGTNGGPSRFGDALFRSGAVQLAGDDSVGFVYKAAAEIGELGDNGTSLRRSLRDDDLLRKALDASPRLAGEVPIVLGHTRWASVGLINEANAHPLNQEEREGSGEPYVVAALNGDVDNYRTLCEEEGIEFPEEITTDAKVIPVLISRRLREGEALEAAFRRTVSSFSGSVAIAAHAASDPDRLLLALHGSGQALYVGLSDDGFIVASEPYGVVEYADRYLRLDGEVPGNPANPSASRGQIVILDRRAAGTLEGIERFAYDGTPLPVGEEELLCPTVTTRDIDRGDAPHYLLKEISQAADSFRKTLRGRLVEDGEGFAVRLGEGCLAPEVVRRLEDGLLHDVIVIGQGTAQVAGQAIAGAMRGVLPRDRFDVSAMPATELSGFRLERDMSHVLVVAISQSGTTTDTNRTVDLVRGRGGLVISIVNRRSSDLTDKSDGVLYTSDGRDVEMSVASTKAFYSQVAAGCLLACALEAASRRGRDGEATRPGLQRRLAGLAAVPAAMEQVLEMRGGIARIASRHAPPRRYWAVVGNGVNRAAAEEIRIKLSELCYKSVSCDATEDKKHIDLSCEPLVLVCAAGLGGSRLGDVAKEVAIYNAHKALPIVIVSEGRELFGADTEVIEVPVVEPEHAFILSAMVGHLFSYEAALAIDRLANPIRAIRSRIDEIASIAQPGEDLLESLEARTRDDVQGLMARLGEGRYDGVLEASTALALTSLLRYVVGLTPLESYIAEYGRVGSPAVVIEALTEAATKAIEELTRPIDAIKHQAKTVTVGISRADEALLHIPLVAAALAAGLSRERISYHDLRSLAGLDPAVAEVTGFTHYRLGAASSKGRTDTLVVTARGGVAENLDSRTVANPELRGTKHLVASERRLLVARGRSDGRTFVLIPEIDRTGVVGLLLLHVRFRSTASPAALRGVLSSYRNRYSSLRDAVMETEPEFREELFAELPVADLLTAPLHDLASRWQKRPSLSPELAR